MKFLVPNYICLQNPRLVGYRPQIPILSVLCPQLNLLNPPTPGQNSWLRHCLWQSRGVYNASLIRNWEPSQHSRTERWNFWIRNIYFRILTTRHVGELTSLLCDVVIFQAFDLSNRLLRLRGGANSITKHLFRPSGAGSVPVCVFYYPRGLFTRRTLLLMCY